MLRVSVCIFVSFAILFSLTLHAQDSCCAPTLKSSILFEKVKPPPDTVRLQGCGVRDFISCARIKTERNDLTITRFVMIIDIITGDDRVVTEIPNVGNTLNSNSVHCLSKTEDDVIIHFDCIVAVSAIGESFVLQPLTITAQQLRQYFFN